MIFKDLGEDKLEVLTNRETVQFFMDVRGTEPLENRRFTFSIPTARALAQEILRCCEEAGEWVL